MNEIINLGYSSEVFMNNSGELIMFFWRKKFDGKF